MRGRSDVAADERLEVEALRLLERRFEAIEVADLVDVSVQFFLGFFDPVEELAAEDQ